MSTRTRLLLLLAIIALIVLFLIWRSRKVKGEPTHYRVRKTEEQPETGRKFREVEGVTGEAAIAILDELIQMEEGLL